MEPIPEDVVADGPEAVRLWRARKAAEWEANHAQVVRRIRLSKEKRRSLMLLPPDVRMLTCSHLPPLAMYMFYQSNLGEPEDDGQDFRAWCNRTTRDSGEEIPCIWDVLLERNYPQAGRRDPKMSGDQRRWWLYAWDIQDSVQDHYVFSFIDQDPKKDLTVDLLRMNRYHLYLAEPLQEGTMMTSLMQELRERIVRHGVKFYKEKITTTQDYILATDDDDTRHPWNTANILYELFAGGWLLRLGFYAWSNDEEVMELGTHLLNCAACGGEDARLLCNVCGDYAFCSARCSDALAAEHHARCYDRGCCEEVAEIVATLGLPYEGHEHAVSTIEAHLETQGSFSPAVLAVIGASSTRTRKKRLASHKRHVQTNKAQAGFHRKEAAKHKATFNDPNASAAQKREAKKQAAFHEKRAAHHDKRAAVHGAAKARGKAQLAPREGGQTGGQSQKQQQGQSGGPSGQPPPIPPRDTPLLSGGETLLQRHEREQQEQAARHAAEREALGL